MAPQATLLWMDEPIVTDITSDPGIVIRGRDAEAFLLDLGTQYRELERLRQFHREAMRAMPFERYLAISPNGG